MTVVTPVQLFQYGRTILCLCPCCGDIVRLSDLVLQYKDEPPRTWLDEYKHRVDLFEESLELFQSKEAEIRESSREKGRRLAARQIRKVVKETFPGCSYHPKDIKALLHPVDCIVFSGMAMKDRIDKIVMLSNQSELMGYRKLR
ncbi:MAG: hypothetical protein E4H14_19070 [Candidatus Thorarchaeota archaeon]|nr:MAG: hypothetical protein E4H14_19070 [Candidatus Thorarchaeota archaeon]